MTDSTHGCFDTLATILLRSRIFGLLFLLLWFGIYMLASKVIYQFHGTMFGLSGHDLDVIRYCGMAFVKLSVILFFFFPWLAIRLVVKRRTV